MTTVLVIDDLDSLRRMIRRIVEPHGYTVIEAGDGNQALGLLDQPIDLIVTDIFMPAGDGIEFLRKAAETVPDIPVIAVSGGGKAMPTTVALSLSQACASRILYKPFGGEELLQCMRELLYAADRELGQGALKVGDRDRLFQSDDRA